MFSGILNEENLFVGSLSHNGEGYFEILAIDSENFIFIDEVFDLDDEGNCSEIEQYYNQVRCLIRWLSVDEVIANFPAADHEQLFNQKFLSGKCHRKLNYSIDPPKYQYVAEGSSVTPTDSFITFNGIEIY